MQSNSRPPQEPSISSQTSGVAELTDWGVIRVTGSDAATFLQGQLTQDVVQMSMSEARLAAFCNAKGRMQASFIVVKRSHGEWLMLCRADILNATLKRLSMFVMRAKALLTDVSKEFSLFGLLGDAIKNIANDADKVYATATFDAISVVLLHPAAGQRRALWIAPVGTPAPEGDSVSPDLWNWFEVQSGIAMITQPIFEAFVPQMLNYESVGGVNFKKGCYPGQEIVARSQFRGTLKRRAYILHGAAPLASIGQEVFHASDASQPCGSVAAWAPNPTGGIDLLVSMQTSAAADAASAADEGDSKLTLGSADGVALRLLALPYALLEDI